MNNNPAEIQEPRKWYGPHDCIISDQYKVAVSTNMNQRVLNCSGLRTYHPSWRSLEKELHARFSSMLNASQSTAGNATLRAAYQTISEICHLEQEYHHELTEISKATDLEIRSRIGARLVPRVKSGVSDPVCIYDDNDLIVAVAISRGQYALHFDGPLRITHHISPYHLIERVHSEVTNANRYPATIDPDQGPSLLQVAAQNMATARAVACGFEASVPALVDVAFNEGGCDHEAENSFD